MSTTTIKIRPTPPATIPMMTEVVKIPIGEGRREGREGGREGREEREDRGSLLQLVHRAEKL